MAEFVEAIYADGTLHPVAPLNLEEQQRVRLIIEPVNGKSESPDPNALDKLLDRLGRSSFNYGGRMPSREELHDR